LLELQRFAQLGACSLCLSSQATASVSFIPCGKSALPQAFSASVTPPAA